MKKIILSESKKQTIINEKEKAILESFSKIFNKIKRIDENEVPDQNYEMALEKEMFKFAQSPEFADMVSGLMKNDETSINENMADFAEFNKFYQEAKSEMPLDEEQKHSELANLVAHGLKALGLVNVLSLGTLPMFVGKFIDSSFGTHILKKAEALSGGVGHMALYSAIASLLVAAIAIKVSEKIPHDSLDDLMR